MSMKKQDPKNFSYQEALDYLARGLAVGREDWMTRWLELDPKSGKIVHFDDGVRSGWDPSPEDQSSKWGLR